MTNSPTAWATLTADAALQALATTRSGLADAQAELRLRQVGANTLPHAAQRPWYQELAANFVHLFALLLWVGAALAWVAGMPQLAWAMPSLGHP